MNRRCSRCGGTGLVTRGQVVNGVCYGCGGNGVRRVIERGPRSTRGGRMIQYVIVDADGRHLAINTDRAVLETLFPSIAGAVRIDDYTPHIDAN